MTKEFRLVGFVQFYCLYFVFFCTYAQRMSRLGAFQEMKKINLQFLSERSQKIATFFIALLLGTYNLLLICGHKREGQN